MRRATVLVSALALSVTLLQGCGGGDDPASPGDPPVVPYVLVPLAPGGIGDVSTQASAMDPAGTSQGGVRFRFVNDARALVWMGTNTAVDLGPGEITDLGGGVQVGFTGVQGLSSERAVLWSGSEASRIDLHPAGYFTSIVRGGGATIQVGHARPTSDTEHAVLWLGTAASVVDLHPAGYSLSDGYDGNSAVQVGTGRRDSDGSDRALLWRGTAASVVDLGPGVAWAVSGDMQVGQGVPSTGSQVHAFLWRGTEASRVDLHPTGFNASRAFGVAGTWQAGEGDLSGGRIRALVWEGTAASVVNLHSVTQTYIINGAPPAHSFARGVDADGNVVGTVRSVTGQDYAVLWKRI